MNLVRGRRGRLGWALIGLALVAAVVLTVLTRPGPEFTDTLDPENPGPNGGQGLARVLAREGVEVEVVRSAAAFDAASTDDATVVVTTPDRLGEKTYERLVAHADTAPIVYVAPSGVAEMLGVGSPITSTVEDLAIPAACVDGAERPPHLERLRLEEQYVVLYPLDVRDGGTGCFLGDVSGRFEGAEVQQIARRGSAAPLRRAVLVALPAGGMVFGAPRALSNDRITDGDNAAIGLRLLGERDRLVWYVPDLADSLPSDAASGVSAEVPDWLVPGLWLLALVAIASVLWRGRRLGPLVTERLPVTVRAIETTISRGRLYLRSRDAAHAAAELRRASRARAVRRLRLPRGATDLVVVDAVAEHTGRPTAEVATLLIDDDTAIARESDLLDLATRLRTLDDDLRLDDHLGKGSA